MKKLIAAVALVALNVTVAGCISFGGKPSNYTWTAERMMLVTGYCDCKKCTGWKRSWSFKKVNSAGANKGSLKEVGVTASGTYAEHGTIAADTTRYPFGTVMYVPGYGYGRVEDRGSAIQGEHIDLFFKTHKDALRWGRQHRKVTVYAMR